MRYKVLLEADLFAVKTISSRVALTLAHSQYYFAMQKKLEHVQKIELEKRQMIIKNSQISIQKSIRAIQFFRNIYYPGLAMIQRSRKHYRNVEADL